VALADHTIAGVAQDAASFPALSARRLLVAGGMALFLCGTIFGDIFAVFILHPNAGRVGQALAAAAMAVRAKDVAGVLQNFNAIGGFLENRGTKVDAHLHMIVFGYLAMLIAIVLPHVHLSEAVKKRLAVLLITGAVVLPVGVFAIPYVGLAYSPLQSIGWASIIADTGGFLVILAGAGFLAGLFRRASGINAVTAEDQMLGGRSWCGRLLMAGGMVLILAGFVQGVWYAAVDLDAHEKLDHTLLETIAQSAALDPGGAELPASTVAALNGYGYLQADHAVKIAAHSHIIEFGLLAMMAGFFQPYVFLSDRWRRRWAVLLLAGGAILPIFVLLELRWGLVAGGIADAGGALAILALFGMLTGILRFTGKADSSVRAAGGRR
jgi:hypothetical protein